MANSAYDDLRRLTGVDPRSGRGSSGGGSQKRKADDAGRARTSGAEKQPGDAYSQLSRLTGVDPRRNPLPSTPAQRQRDDVNRTNMSAEDLAMERLMSARASDFTANNRPAGSFSVDFRGLLQGAETGINGAMSNTSMRVDPNGFLQGAQTVLNGVNPAAGRGGLLSDVYDRANGRMSSLLPQTEENAQYREILQRPDFAEYSTAQGSKRRFFGGDELYDYINNIGDEREQADMAQRRGTGAKDYGKYAFMTEDEIGVYNYLYATEGKKAANRFLKQLEPALNEQWYSGASAANQERALEHPLLYSAATVAAQPARMATSMAASLEDTFRAAAGGGTKHQGLFGGLIDDMTAQQATEQGHAWDVRNGEEQGNPFENIETGHSTGDNIDPYSGLRQLSRMTTDVRGAIAEDLENNPGALGAYFMQQAQMQAGELSARYAMANGEGENPIDKARENITPVSGGKAVSFAYQTAMSAADSAVNMLMASGIAEAGLGSMGVDFTTKAGVDALRKATNVIGSLTMSSEVMSLGVAEAKEKGFSDEGALLTGLIRGAIEYASEALGGEWVIKNIQANPLNFVKSMVLNMIPEGVEEVMSDIGNGAVNLIMDGLFNTQESGWLQMRAEFSKQGWQQNYPTIAKIMETMGWGNDPDAATLLYFLGEEGMSFLGGAMATFGTSYVQGRRVNRGINATSSQIGATPQEVVQLMQEYQTENPYHIGELGQFFEAESAEDFRAKAGTDKTAEEILEATRTERDAKRRTDAVGQSIRRRLGVLGFDISDSEARVLAQGYEAGDADPETYLNGIADAFRMGQGGKFTLQEAIRATDAAAVLNDAQFRQAFQLGQLRSGVETVDTTTGEGQDRLEASFASMGNNAQMAIQAYEEGQDIDTYAAAMTKAAALYAANGQDLHAIAEQARSGERSDIIGRLTDAQLDVATEIGQRMAAEGAEAVRARADSFRALRERATAAGIGTNVRGRLTMATTSGTVSGIKYNAVDESKLSRVQKSTVSAVKAVSEALGLDVVVISSKQSTGGVYTGGGRIYLNIDAGTNIRGFGKAIAAGSFAHEMVHWMREYAGEQYEALKKITTGHLTSDQLDKLVQEQLRMEPNLKPDAALEEVIANACQPLLQNSKAIRELVRQDMNLAERMLDRLKEFAENLKTAFSEIDYKSNLSIYHAVQAMEDHLEEMQEAFDKAIMEARQNMAAERAMRSATAQRAGTTEAAQALEVTVGEDELRIDEDGQMALFQQMTEPEQQTQVGAIDLRNFTDAVGADGKPLFQRIDVTNDDTEVEAAGRQTAYARLQNENAILSRTVKALNKLTGKQASTIEVLQKQLHLSKTAAVREDDARSTARSLIKEYGSSADVNAIAEELKSLGDYILQTKPSEIRETEIKDRARDIAAQIISSVSETVDLTEGVGMPQDVAAQITPEQVNPFEAYMGEATEGLANRIAMGAVGGILRQDVTAMDRQKARREELRGQIEDLKAQVKAGDKATRDAYQTIYDLTLALDKAESQYRSLQIGSERRLAEVREQGRARVAEARAEKWEKVAETKKYYQDMIERQREKRENATSVRGSRSKIQKLYKEFVREIQHPTETKHIPPQLMQQAADILSALNMDNSRPGSKAGAALKAKLAALKVAYDAIQKDADFRAAAVYDPIVSEMMQTMIEQVGDTPINRMSREQLEIVYNVLKAMKVTATKALKVQLGEEERNAYEISVQMTNETRSARNAAGTGLFARWLNAQLSPERMFHRLGGFHKNSMWSKVYQMLNAGQLKSTQIFVEGSRIFDKLLQGKDYDAFVNPNRTVDIGLKDENGNSVPITRGMMVSLYMHLMNEDNIRHAMLGGIEIPALKDYYNGRKTRGTERSVRVGGIALDSVKQIAELREQLKETEDENERKDIQAEINDLTQEALGYADVLRGDIEKQLTDYDRKWISAIRELFDNFSKNKINETTMAVYGIKKASVDNYYPIWVDGDFLNTPFESVARDFSIENVGFLKERVSSSKPIRLADASEVAASQLKKVSQYAGLMPVIRDFNKIWGKTQASYADSLKKAVHSVFGETGTKYVENLMADLNGARSQDDGFGGEFFGRIRGNMAQAALTLSMRTAFGQTASYPTAASVVGWGPLMKALAKGGRSGRVFSRADQDLIEKYSPLLAYRMKGYSSTELGDIASSNDKRARLWRKMRWLTGWIQAMDGATVGKLWYAAEYYVQDHNKDLEKGSENYYEEVAKVFNNIVEKTQPNYTTMQRPDILRNPNALVRSLTMFLTQRLQNVNIVIDAAATLSQAKKDYAAKRFDVTKEDVQEAAVNTRRAVVSQLVAAATIVAFKAAADAILHSMNAYRREKDKELTAESVSMELLDMFLDSVTGNFLWGSELYDLVESRVFGKTYYGIELSSMSTVTDMIESFNNLLTEMLENGVSGENFEKRLNTAAKNLASVLGIPLGNAEKIVMGVVYHAQDIANGKPGSFEAGVYWLSKAVEKRWKQNLESMGVTQHQFAQYLSEAETNGKPGVTMDEAGAWLANELDQGNMSHELVDAYWAATGDNWQKSFDEWRKDDFKSTNYSAAKRAAFSGDTAGYKKAVEDLAGGGIKDKAVRSEIKGFIRKAFLGEKLSEDEAAIVGSSSVSEEQARRMLHDYAGLSAQEAIDQVADWKKTKAFVAEHGAEYEKYDLTVAQAQFYYGTAHSSVNLETYAQQVETYGMDALKAYYGADGWKATGLTIEQYSTYRTGYAQCKGTDKDGDGKTDSGSKKAEVLALINSLPVSRTVKDALYRKNGWAERELKNAPWRR